MWLIFSLLVLLNICNLFDASSYGRDFLQCSVWGNSHGFNFDDEGFEINGYCSYILATTKCLGYNINSKIVPFTIELERSVDDKSILVVAVKIEIYGTTYKLLRGRNVLVDGVLVSKPYRSSANDVMINYQANNMIFNTKFIQLHWDGYEHIDVYLCDEYKGKVCGMCGNADGIQGNDFTGVNNTNLLADSKHYKYKDWTDLWQNEKSKTSCASTSFTNIVRCNQDKFKTNDYCGLITSFDSPWSLCLKKLPQTLIDKIYDSCVFDMCQFQMNRIQQQKAKCDNFQRLSQACYDIGITNFEWRKRSECPLLCADNEYYAVAKSCPKTCLDPSGTDCGALVYKEGCLCKSGYVLDSRETCIAYKECGCKSHDGTQIIEVGDSYNAADCTKTFSCDGYNSNCVMKTMVCGNQRICGINDEFRYSCVECPVETVFINGTCVSVNEIKKLREPKTTKEMIKSTMPVQIIETTALVKPTPEIVKEETTTPFTEKIITTTVFIKPETERASKVIKEEPIHLSKQIPKEVTSGSTKYISDKSTAKYYTPTTKQNYYTTTYRTYSKTQISSHGAAYSGYKNNPYNNPNRQIQPTQSSVPQVATLGVTLPSLNFQTPNMMQMFPQLFTTPSSVTQIATLGVTFPTFTIQTPSPINLGQFFTTPSPFTQIATLGVTAPSFTFPTQIPGNLAQFYGQMFATPAPFTQVATLGVTVPTFTFPTQAPGNIGQFYGQMFTTPFPFTQVATLGVTAPTFNFPTQAPGNIGQFYGQMFTTPFPLTQVATLGVTVPTFTLPSQNGGNIAQFYGQMFATAPSATQIATLGVTVPSFMFQTPAPIPNFGQLYGQMQMFTTPSPFTQVATLGVTVPTFTFPTQAPGNIGQLYGQMFATPSPFTQVATLGVTVPTFTFPTQAPGNIGQFYGQMFTTPFPLTQVATLGVTVPTFTLPSQNGGNIGQLYGQMFTTPFPFTQVATLGVTAPTFNFPTQGPGNIGQFYGQMFTTPSPFTQVATLGVTLPTFNLPTQSPFMNQPNFAQLYGQMFATAPSATQIATLGVTAPSFMFQTPAPGAMPNMAQLYGQFFNTQSPFTQIATLGVTMPTFTIATPSPGDLSQMLGQMLGQTPAPIPSVSLPTQSFPAPSNRNQGQSYGSQGHSYGNQKSSYGNSYSATKIATLGVTPPTQIPALTTSGNSAY